MRDGILVLSDLRGILVVGLSYVAFIMLRHFPSVLTLLRICIINGCWILPKAYSVSIEMIISFLFFNLLTTFFNLFFNIVPYCLICGYWTILANWGNPTWSWWIISLMYCWFQVANIFWAFLCLCLLEMLLLLLLLSCFSQVRLCVTP